MKKILQLCTVISVLIFIISCKKHKDVVVTPVTVTYDADAQKFFDSTGISDTLQKSALNALVRQLKDSALWAKFSAIYPMVGGSANYDKWNLKDPRNTDAAYRLSFNGAPTFSGDVQTTLFLIMNLPFITPLMRPTGLVITILAKYQSAPKDFLCFQLRPMMLSDMKMASLLYQKDRLLFQDVQG